MAVVRVVLQKGKAIPEHKTSGEIIVQCLEGKIALKAMNTTNTLTAGQMLYLAGASLTRWSASRTLRFC